jgi:hypothetical protein
MQTHLNTKLILKKKKKKNCITTHAGALATGT